MSEKRMSCMITCYPSKVVVTCTPLVPGVTKEELYDEEARLLMEFGPKWVDLLKAMGVSDIRVSDIRIERDHEEPTRPQEDAHG